MTDSGYYATAQLRRGMEALILTHPALEKLLHVAFALSAAIGAVVLTLSVLDLRATPTSALAWGHIGVLAISVAGAIALVVFNYSTRLRQATITMRVTSIAMILTLLTDVSTHGLRPLQLLYIFQVLSLIVFAVLSNAHMARNDTFRAPWEISADIHRLGYIPLNFFNLFWVFFVASIAGLGVEIVYRLMTVGTYQDRAGLLWGPFSPIYGFGALLMTIALNRWWKSHFSVIFIVAGTIGAAFEYFVSWYMEVVFGITAWDYTGTFLSINGRTNFGFFCAWGILGLVWIKILLPDVLKLVDAIPLRWRAILTTLIAVFMAVNGVMTLLTIDRWYNRQIGVPPSHAVMEYIDTHYDDSYMQHRFQTMHIDPDRAQR